MGIMTLADFRSELDESIGTPALGNTRYDRWINAAYFEVSGAIEFQQLLDVQSFTTVDGTQAYNEAGSTLGIRQVFDVENDAVLLHESVENFLLRDEDTEGDPLYWTRFGGQLHLWPVPGTTGDTIKYLRIKQPTVLSASGSVTVLPAQWDMVVWMMSVHYALLSREEQEFAAMWFNRAVSMIRSRTTDLEYDADSREVGVTIAKSLSDLNVRPA